MLMLDTEQWQPMNKTCPNCRGTVKSETIDELIREEIDHHKIDQKQHQKQTNSKKRRIE